MRVMKDSYTNAMKHVKVTLILSRKVTMVFLQETIVNLYVKRVHLEFYRKKKHKNFTEFEKVRCQ